MSYKKVSLIIGLLIGLLLIGGMKTLSQAEDLSLPDSALEGISAEGISVGGDFSTSCSTTSTSICLGTYEWNDNHQYDASDHKGAIDMDGYVQQNVTAEINLNQTQSAAATGVNIIGDISTSGVTIQQNNTNNATSFVGGF